ncbi:plasma-membrane calcium-translocating P-type ATPase [Carnobacterium alterfunditum]|uniref:P-type Ca(2+) transporter n=1 Tax=Carnobacterium alterfunditum TaxID=28230 RepID=A0A1N6FIQ8_9LACT|nr:cation-translocating P-type ATPase [Carnobacterium alterfunditum]SIN95163.1 plasma-membrane calcium-translocating P-type ATPase [Carnobacterium alterfunditum]
MNFKTKKTDFIIDEFNSHPKKGLTSKEVEQYKEQFGLNQFEEAESVSLFSKVIDQLKDVTVIILIFAGVISTYIAITEHPDDFSEPIVIFSIILINVIIAIRQEGKAEKALASLQSLSAPKARVVRNGQEEVIDAIELVPGDILLLESGNKIPADARLLSSSNLQVEESALTGESIPVEKNENAEVEENSPVGDIFNTVFSGTLVTKGRAKAIVVATGMDTEMGSVADLLNRTKEGKTPLQSRMDRLGKQISILALIAGIIIFTLSFMQGEALITSLMTAVSLAVAAVPETLPVIVTITLAYGVQNMVERNAIIRTIPSVETLGSASVIASDKTGTLTQNQMTIQKIWAFPHEPIEINNTFNEDENWVLKMMSLASNAAIEDRDGEEVNSGDPTETAIIRLLQRKGFSKNELDKAYPRIHEIPFDSSRKMMTTIHELDEGYISITKGAFDHLPVDFSSAADEVGQKAKSTHDSFAHDALRVIAVGYKKYAQLPENLSTEELESGITFAGIVGMIDPPREESLQAVKEAKSAGIKTIMITGDHAATASAIAEKIGILEKGDKTITGVEMSEISDEKLTETIRDYSVYARVSPEDKIRIVKAWQSHGEVVAMTGDGVNDAPALKAADVGTAMGITGTEVAKNAADMVLTDDKFDTIVHAVEEGRRVYENIKKTVYFLLSCNISEIFIMLIAVILGWGLPLIAIQLLFINVVADGIPGFALSREKADPTIMKNRPTAKGESIFANGGYLNITIASLAFIITTLIGFYIGAFVGVDSAITASHEVGQTTAFIILGWSSVLHIFNARSKESIFKVGITSNLNLFLSALLSIVLLTLVATVPFLADIFNLVDLSTVHWLIAIGLAISILIVVELQKLIMRKMNKAF